MPGHVVIIDNDKDIAEIVRAVLNDEGYQVTILSAPVPEALTSAVGTLEPDCVLLDGEGYGSGFGRSWGVAGDLGRRERRVPVVMFSADGSDLREAREGVTQRARDANLSGVLAKPFEVDDLLRVVAAAVGASIPFDRSPAADRARTERLVADLLHAGAVDVRASSRREWVTFRTARDRVMQVYWWQTGGAYLVGRYDEDGRRMQNIALTHDRASAIDVCATIISGDLVAD